jgi:hypothetical protein
MIGVNDLAHVVLRLADLVAPSAPVAVQEWVCILVFVHARRGAVVSDSLTRH